MKSKRGIRRAGCGGFFSTEIFSKFNFFQESRASSATGFVERKVFLNFWEIYPVLLTEAGEVIFLGKLFHDHFFRKFVP